MAGERILIIEDDAVIREELKTLLTGNGYKACAVTDFARVMEEFGTFRPRLVLLDIKLPGGSGFSICSRIRAESVVPIIFVTGSNTELDELRSIMLGGDAFITKPYHTAILLAKIASLLAKSAPQRQTEDLSWKGAVLHPECATISATGGAQELTKNEQKILYYLFVHAGTICARGDLIEYLWDNQLYVDDNALSVNINRIREKLRHIGLSDFIVTKPRQGYII